METTTEQSKSKKSKIISYLLIVIASFALGFLYNNRSTSDETITPKCDSIKVNSDTNSVATPTIAISQDTTKK